MPEPGVFSRTDVALANRNKGMPLEALRHDITPVGMHYLLTHFDIPALDARDYRLEIDGLVETPQRLTLEGLQALDRTTRAVTMECAGNGRAELDPRPVNMPWGVEAVGTAEWTGVPLRDVIDRAGIRDAAIELVFSGADEGIQGGVRHHYQRSLTIEAARRPEVLLAWAMNEQPLEPQHGAPLRLIVPGWYGMASVKWLTRIEAVAAPFRGPQQGDAYTIHGALDEPGEMVERMRVRALMTPPGVPDFPSLERTVDAGPVRLVGRAWSGEASITGVEVGIDDTWAPAQLDEPVGDDAWSRWSFHWDATPGEHVLTCRATDASGQTQPLEADWNLGGYCNNMVQSVRLSVE